jgi:4-hydroxy-4-methyl-2-oxoglutarate aldolase
VRGRSSISQNAERVARLGRLYVAVVADVLDEIGVPNQVMKHAIRPMSTHDRLAGVAFPIQEGLNPDPTPKGSSKGRIAAVDALPPGAVAVVSAGGYCEAAVWGELLSTRALACGAVGIVTDGAIRDIALIKRLNFPTFAAAICARDAGGRLQVISYGEPLVCGGVSVSPGDLILGDPDGVVVVPARLADETLAIAEEKRRKEDLARGELRAGESASSVLQRHGVI